MKKLNRIIEYIRHFLIVFNPYAIVLRRSSKAIGDNLLLSAILPFLKQQDPKRKIAVETNFPELFFNNPYCDFATNIKWVNTLAHRRPRYKYDQQETRHLIRQMLQVLGIDDFGKPQLYLTDTEKKWVKDLYPFPYLTIAPQAKTIFAANRKDWDFDRFQKIVDDLPQYKFVQIGSPKDTSLKNVIDGRLMSLRDTAAIIWNSQLFLGLEGGMMHLAKAVDKVSVIVLSGYIRPEMICYPDNENVFIPVNCSPCGHSDAPHSDCPEKKCTDQITPEMVEERIRKIAG